jgi:(E)-4-hydroxy-3-methylbut-2-enyl-diphosphate synthase
MSELKPYCNDLFNYSRFKTREVKVGSVGIGGENPIRLQSMTTTDTMDTVKTVEQSIRMINAGCELVRITAPSMNEAKNLEVIKKELRARGYDAPLVADIHFTPNAAEFAARVVEKVRVNPGNYADKKKFEEIEYTDASYDEELERIRERFTPLVKICKEYGTAMRIGTNHGSLSDRILSRYGDTPLGMVESAMEFLRICEEQNYYDIVLSMKASNPQVMVQAYRLLVSKMVENKQNYPLHLGVTEAGEGEDGRIKSAVGIGTLLEDGLGDTIRVSLTEEPELEIPVAKELADRYKKGRKEFRTVWVPGDTEKHSPYEYERKRTNAVLNVGGANAPCVIADYSMYKNITAASLFAVGYNYSPQLDKWNISDQACDFIYVGENEVNFEVPGTLGLIYDFKKYKTLKNKTRCYPFFTWREYMLSMADRKTDHSQEMNFALIDDITNLSFSEFSIQREKKDLVLILKTRTENAMQALRGRFLWFLENEVRLPMIIQRDYTGRNEEQLQLFSSTDIGGLLLDGFGDGVWIRYDGGVSRTKINSTAFGILQATRTRISKTEYISCPSCGRTLFDLQETTAKIRQRTDHLKGVKIGIMGCIVNGPGEMADADYGYVGTGIGKITLYKGKNVVKRNIPSEGAVDELIELIKEGGDWVEKD